MVDFKRKITHTGYKYEKNLRKYYHRVEKKIYEKPSNRNKLSTKKEEKYGYTTDEYITINSKGTITPLYTGGVCWFIVVSSIYSYFSGERLEFFEIFIFILCTILAVFFTVYYFTKPPKEQILNRRDGLITMDGFYWQENITIPFKDCLFAYSTGGEDGTGAFMLEAIRPTTSRLNSYSDFNMGEGDCYKAMSYICWFMDKNRPLPPGNAFDEYRQRDFERRKGEGFPRPLYHSSVPTPEATREQQKERKKIGGW